jgi:hypothetical protein
VNGGDGDAKGGQACTVFSRCSVDCGHVSMAMLPRIDVCMYVVSQKFVAQFAFLACALQLDSIPKAPKPQRRL